MTAGETCLDPDGTVLTATSPDKIKTPTVIVSSMANSILAKATRLRSCHLNFLSWVPIVDFSKTPDTDAIIPVVPARNSEITVVRNHIAFKKRQVLWFKTSAGTREAA